MPQKGDANPNPTHKDSTCQIDVYPDFSNYIQQKEKEKERERIMDVQSCLRKQAKHKEIIDSRTKLEGSRPSFVLVLAEGCLS